MSLSKFGLAARGTSAAAFDGRCIPPACVASRSNTGRYSPVSRLVRRAPHPSRCDAGVHHGLLALLFGSLLLAACGGGEEAGTLDPTPAEPAAPIELLGGGAMTPVHDGLAGSPHVKVDWEVDGANISISYGRPLLKGRVVGESVEPMDGFVWRLGADEATIFTTDRDLMLGTAHVPAGEYSLWTIAQGDVTELIVNHEVGHWGTDHDASRDMGRAQMAVGQRDAPAEQLTLHLENGDFRIEWGTMVASVPILVH